MCHVTPELITYWSIFCVTLPPDDQLNKYLTNNYIELCHSFLELDQVKGYKIDQEITKFLKEDRNQHIWIQDTNLKRRN